MDVTIKEGIATLSHDGILIDSVESALDLVLSVAYEKEVNQIILPKRCVAEDFFRLSNRLAGEILQKFIVYQVRLAIVGDFSIYTSKPLLDFMRESNRGSHFYFVATEQEAREKLSKRST